MFPHLEWSGEHNDESQSLAFGALDVRRYWILSHLISPVCQFADRTIAVSEVVASRVRGIPGVRGERVHVVHNAAYSPEIEETAKAPVNNPWLNEQRLPVILELLAKISAPVTRTVLSCITLSVNDVFHCPWRANRQNLPRLPSCGHTSPCTG